jgi:multicomponent Na+:H+ antiporter subunit E
VIVRAALLTAVWLALTGDASPVNAAFGFALGWGALRLAGPSRPFPADALRRLPAAASLAAFVGWELLVSNLRVMRAVLSPRSRLRPALVAVPLDVRSDAGIALFANLVTLTPGTLSVDVSTDRSTLYVHALVAPDPDAVVRELKDGLERRVRRVLP